jgi:hypothetical protein
MRKITILLSLGFVLLLLGRALAVNPIELTTSVESVNFAPPAARSNPSPAVAQFAYDAALTNIGVHAPRDTCIFEGDDLTIWVKVHNAGYEIVDCAEVAFTMNGDQFARIHVSGLYPDEIRKYSATTVAPPGCEPYTIAAHIDWPLDENPDNNDIEDTFATAEQADSMLRHDDGRITNGWCWPPGYEYPGYAIAAKYQMPFEGIVKYWTWWYSQSVLYPRGHVELFVWAADTSGYPIDDGTGGLCDMQFQVEEILWIDAGYICYPICMPVSEGEYYFFGYSNRQNTVQFMLEDGLEENPDWNWHKSAGVWYPGGLYGFNYWVRVYMDVPGVMMTCENLTPIFCRGKNFYFKLTVENRTEGNVSGPMAFGGYAGYDCDPGNNLANIARNKNYPPGITETYYFFQVPNAAVPGRYSASVDGHLGGYNLFCCMNADIIQCSPFRTGDCTTWELVEVNSPDVILPRVTELHQNYPNPFNTETNIGYNLAEAGNVSLKVYDISGRLVTTLVEGYQEARQHSVNWDASQVSSGVYFYKLTCGDYTATKKMNLLR